MAVADPDVLILPSEMMVISLDDFCISSKARLSFDK